MEYRPKQLAYKYFIEKFSSKTKSCIGVEIEMPIINLDKKPVEAKFIKAMFCTLSHEFCFKITKSTIDSFPIEAINDAGDMFSLETSFNTIEFSMAKRESITEIAKSFYRYLGELKKIEGQYNHLICGMGINPYPQYADTTPLNTPSMIAKSDFLKNYTSHHDGEVFHSFSASIHIHFDTHLKVLIDKLNLLRKLSFVSGILFSNSLPFKCTDDEAGSKWRRKLPLSISSEMDCLNLCFRDILWKYSEAPNTEDFYRDYQSIDDLMTHLLTTKAFVVGNSDGEFKAIQPTPFSEYFSDKKNLDGDVIYFRSMQPVAITKCGTFEIRSTCTQALSDIFEPVAFYTGILENYVEVSQLMDQFFITNNIKMTNSELRQKAIFEQSIVSKEKLELFIRRIISISYDGLKKRSRGETVYLEKNKHLKNPTESPAKRQLELLEKGYTWDEIILSYSKLDGK